MSASESEVLALPPRLFCLGRLAYINLAKELILIDLNTEEKKPFTIFPTVDGINTELILWESEKIHFFWSNVAWTEFHHEVLDPSTGQKETVSHKTEPFDWTSLKKHIGRIFYDRTGVERIVPRLFPSIILKEYAQIRRSNKNLYVSRSDGIFRYPLDETVGECTKLSSLSKEDAGRISVMEMENGMTFLSSTKGERNRTEQKNIVWTPGVDFNMDAQGDIICGLQRKKGDNIYAIIREVFTDKMSIILKVTMLQTDRPDLLVLLPPNEAQITAWIKKVQNLLAFTPLPPELSRIIALLML